MLRRSIVSLSIVVALCTLARADSTVYYGALTSGGGGITGLPGSPWLTGDTTFSWAVTDHGNGTYTYDYQLQVPSAGKEISHLTIEVSPTFTAGNILNVSKGTLAGGQPGTYPTSGDPGMPGPMTGLQFQDGYGSDNYNWIVAFTSDRAPMWGDFYAKDGRWGDDKIAIWNAGFAAGDPTVPVSSGSYLNHVLVPDTRTSLVPAPGAILLGSLGAGLVSWLRRRKML